MSLVVSWVFEVGRKPRSELTPPVDQSFGLGHTTAMLVAFIESAKYVGHLLPVALLRVFLGVFYFQTALAMVQSDFLRQAYLAEDIRANLPESAAPEWYRAFLENIVIPNWQVFAFAIATAYLAIGISYIIGYLVRPVSVMALILVIVMMGALGPGSSEIQTNFMFIVHFTLGWLGAGRCLGIDYYFYKRRRGIWW